MAELIATGPLDGIHAAEAPFEAAGCTLDTLALGPVAAVMPLPGAAADADSALRAAGLGLSDPGRLIEGPEGARVAWAGRETVFLIGMQAPDLPGASVVDLTDGWVGLSLAGPGAVEVLARLVPIDLRHAAFPDGRAARTLLGHIQVLILKRAGRFEILLTRSYARTAWHEIVTAMRAVAARTGT